MTSTTEQSHPRPDPANPHDESSPASSPAISPSVSDELATPSSPLFTPPTLASEDGLSSSAPASAPISASSSSLLGVDGVSRRPGIQPTMSRTGSGLPQSIAAKMDALRLSRQGSPAVQGERAGSVAVPGSRATGRDSGSSMLGVGGIPSGFRMPPGVGRPPVLNSNSAPAVPRGIGGGPSLAQKRGLAPLGGASGKMTAPGNPGPKRRPGLTLSQMNAGSDNGPDAQDGKPDSKPPGGGSLMEKYARYIDPKTGTLKFHGKATISSQGVEFASGKTISISLDEVDTLDELGKGNYGTVYKVRHSRPRLRRPGQGLAGNKSFPAKSTGSISDAPCAAGTEESPTSPTASGGSTGVIMAMKEIRLELDDAKFAAILMELDTLHKCESQYVIDFYGAFFQEGAVYICMEFMDGGSIDKLYGDGIPEQILRKITYSTTMGLKTLKEQLNVIHRDVKPTNILINTRGQIKICDFGVSGNLVASIAKTNIGCQSYMAPERISTGGVAQAGANPGGGTYSVQSDIWSLGLTITECALGRYPYPPETYDNIFSQLSAIVDGDPPDLPEETFSLAAHDFVHGCLVKIPGLRPTYTALLQHAWLAPLAKPTTIVEEDEDEATNNQAANASPAHGSSTVGPGADGDSEVAAWVMEQLERRRKGVGSKTGDKPKPALHNAPLDIATNPAAER